jgi:hypothetical protein
MNVLAPKRIRFIQDLDRTNPYSNIYTLNVGNTYPWLGASETGLGVPIPRSTNLLAVPPRRSNFGKKSKKKITTTGYCIVNNRIRKVYSFPGLVGRRYYNKQKVAKGKVCYKKLEAAKRKLEKDKKKKRKSRRRKSRSRKNEKWVVYHVNSHHRKRISPSIREKGKTLSSLLAKRGLPCEKYKTSGTCLVHDKRCKWDGSSCSNRYSRFGRLINPANRLNYQYQQYATNVGTPTRRQMNDLSGTPAYAYPMRNGARNFGWYSRDANLDGYGF